MLRDQSSAAVFCIIILYLALHKMIFWAKENTDTVSKEYSKAETEVKILCFKALFAF